MFFKLKLRFTGVPIGENGTDYDEDGNPYQWVNAYDFTLFVAHWSFYVGWQKPIDDPYKQGSNLDWEWGWD